MYYLEKIDIGILIIKNFILFNYKILFIDYFYRINFNRNQLDIVFLDKKIKIKLCNEKIIIFVVYILIRKEIYGKYMYIYVFSEEN